MCKPGSTVACVECGAPFVAAKEWSRFCCTACKKAFNNRRAMRGAEMYDVIMTMRFDREAARDERAWQTLCSLAGAYRESDKVRRAGRPSWLKPLSWKFPISFGSAGDGR